MEALKLIIVDMSNSFSVLAMVIVIAIAVAVCIFRGIRSSEKSTAKEYYDKGFREGQKHNLIENKSRAVNALDD